MKTNSPACSVATNMLINSKHSQFMRMCVAAEDQSWFWWNYCLCLLKCEAQDKTEEETVQQTMFSRYECVKMIAFYPLQRQIHSYYSIYKGWMNLCVVAVSVNLYSCFAMTAFGWESVFLLSCLLHLPSLHLHQAISISAKTFGMYTHICVHIYKYIKKKQLRLS